MRNSVVAVAVALLHRPVIKKNAVPAHVGHPANKLEKLKATAVVYKPFDIDVLVKIVENIEEDANFSQIKFLN